MSELSGEEAVTVHRLLGAKFAEDGERVVFTNDEDDRLDCGAVILDECSMVDITLIDALLRAMPDDARLKLRQTLERIINEGTGGLICIIL